MTNNYKLLAGEQMIFQILSIILLFLISYIDLRKTIIPDWCLILFFLFTSLWHPVNLLMAGACLIIAFGTKYLVGLKDALGYGEIKFITIVGFFLTPETLPIFLIASGVTGIIFGLFRTKFPFGPAIAFGALLSNLAVL